jgi:streptogramin lyase
MNAIVPHYQSQMDAVVSKIAELPGRYDNIRHRMETRRTSLHKAIDDIMDWELDKLREIQIRHKAGLLKQLKKIRKKIYLVDKVIERNYDIMSDARLLLEANPLELFTPITIAPLSIKEHSSPEFLTDMDDINEKLKALVGSLVEKGAVVSTYTQELHSTSSLKPMTAPKQISLLECEMKVGDIACERNGSVWICGLGNRHIMQYDMKGKTKNTISATSQPSFVSLNSLGHLYYTEFRDSSVKCVTHMSPQLFAKTIGWQPRGILCTNNDDVIVAEYSESLKHSRIATYNSSGSFVKAVEYNELSKPLFQDILFICQNRNGDIGVTDRAKSVAIVIQQNGQKRFEYSGHIRSSDFSNFYLSGISTDSRCNYVISDVRNFTLHVINWQGKFLFYVMPGKTIAPMAIDVDEKDRVWVVEARGTIRVLTYIVN